MLLIGSKSAHQGAVQFVHPKCTQAPAHMTWFSKLIPPPEQKKKKHTAQREWQLIQRKRGAPEGELNSSRNPSLERFMTAIHVADASHFHTLIIIIIILVKSKKCITKTTGCLIEQDLIINKISLEHLTDRNNVTPNYLWSSPASAVIFFFFTCKKTEVKSREKENKTHLRQFLY